MAHLTLLHVVDERIEAGYVLKTRFSHLLKENIESEKAILYSITASGEELHKSLVKDISNHSVYVLTEGVRMPLGVVEDIFKHYEVVLAAVPEKIRMPKIIVEGIKESVENGFFNIVFSLNEADKEKRIALRFPLAESQSCLRKPNYDYNVMNAFATFMTVNGVQVLYVKQEKDPLLIEEGYLFQLEEYDAHNPPEQFDLVRNTDLDIVLGISKIQKRSFS